MMDVRGCEVEAVGYPAFWLEMIGYDQEFFRPHWFKESPRAPSLLPAAAKDVDS